jgi:para-aminobenzoate synthetase component 1
VKRKKQDTIKKMNELGKQKIPFVFVIDFEQQMPLVFTLEEANDILLWSTPKTKNFKIISNRKKLESWEISPIPYAEYKEGFDLVQKHIFFGDSFLLNYTKPTPVKTNLSLYDIFQKSNAPYKIHLKNKFVCFSPEIFIQIENGKISSFPMKGTIDASIQNARVVLKNDRKELAEHNTIVDLIRNDLSIVAKNVEVETFRYIDHIKTNRQNLLQMSSHISGKLPENYPENLGSIVFNMLPAGSISGAPKPKTIEIIKQAEGYTRGYYTGIFGYFDGQNLDSCVLIRYIENQDNNLIYKSGGGITYMSDCQTEYNEMINKVYVPII